MKFTNGFWLMRQGYVPHFPVQVLDVEITPEALVVYAATKKITGRGDTLDGPHLSMRFSSPLEGVIRVQLTHFKGGLEPRPQFALKDLPPAAVQAGADERSAWLSSGNLTLRVEKDGPWRIDFLEGGRLLTHSDRGCLGMVDTPEGRYVHEQLALQVGECVYGLGERFTPFVKNGQVVDIWNEDGGTASEQAYKNIPFYLTNRGYGVLVNHPERVSFEVASEKVERVQFSLPGERLDYFLISGPTPKEVLRRYTQLTGRPALPPQWSFGLWLSTSFTTQYDEATITSFIQGMQDRHIPLHVFHFDCFWMKGSHWVDFEWDLAQFPDPPAMLNRLKERGLHICLWINPYIAQRSRLFDEAAQHGYLLKRPDGSVWQTDLWQAGMGIVDFTNPQARQWYGDYLRGLLAMGVDCFKTDFGERIPTDVVYADGSDPQRMHNFYAYLYNQTVFDVLEESRGAGEAVVFARSATVGGQRFPVHWGGDSTATFESMAESLRGGLSLGLSGFGFWSHDIGGFEQTAPPEVYKRWCAFGLLSSHSRLHGSASYRVPWLFDEEAVDVLRFFTRLKCRLMPYLYQAACQAHRLGLPVLRAMLVEFPADPACETLDRQYMLGDSLLVAPVFSADGMVSYYVPAGRWTNLLNGAEVSGPAWVQEQHGFLSLPLLVRPGSVIPMGAHDDRPDYDYAAGLTLQAYQLVDGQTVVVEIPGPDGEPQARFEVRRDGESVSVVPQGVSLPWQLLLVGEKGQAAVENGEAEETPPGLLVRPGDPASRVGVTYFL